MTTESASARIVGQIIK